MDFKFFINFELLGEHSNEKCKLFVAFFLVNAFVALASALPYRHLITLDPAVQSLVPEETVVATQLHVMPNAERIGDYEYKEVPLVSRKRAKEIVSAEEDKLDGEEEKETMQNVMNKKEAAEHANNGELINNIAAIAENTQSVADNAVVSVVAT